MIVEGYFRGCLSGVVFEWVGPINEMRVKVSDTTRSNTIRTTEIVNENPDPLRRFAETDLESRP